MSTTRLTALVAVLIAAFGCGRDAVPRDGDALDVSGLPQRIQEDYAVFANRCSKCHSLSRPLALASSHASDAYWDRYIERMRRQPGSGISPADAIVIGRFLHFYSSAQRDGELTAAEDWPRHRKHLQRRRP